MSLSIETPDPGQGGGRRGQSAGGGDRAADVIRKVEAAGRGVGTAPYDSVLLASDEPKAKKRTRRGGGDSVFTDGVDTGVRKVSISTAIEGGHRADTLLYAVRYCR
jgi:hypothetical protein